MALPAAVMAVAAVTQAIGSIRQGQAAQSAADYNASVARQNASIAGQQGELAVNQQQRQAQQQIGAATANYGASGIDSNEGSALDVLRSSAEQSSLAAANIRYNYAVKGAGYNQTANIEQYSGNTAKSNSYYSAAGQLLNGGAKAGDLLDA